MHFAASQPGNCAPAGTLVARPASRVPEQNRDPSPDRRRPRRLVVSSLDALTSSERRVAQLAAAGLSNREIAQTLFVTARTVEGHLTHAYQKLAITSREQLPAALAPPGGGPTAPAPTSP